MYNSLHTKIYEGNAYSNKGGEITYRVSYIHLTEQFIHEFDDGQGFYRYAIGIAKDIPSGETLGQRMDDIRSFLGSWWKQAVISL